MVMERALVLSSPVHVADSPLHSQFRVTALLSQFPKTRSSLALSEEWRGLKRRCKRGIKCRIRNREQITGNHRWTADRYGWERIEEDRFGGIGIRKQMLDQRKRAREGPLFS